MNSSEWKDVKLGEIANFKTGKLNSNAAENNGMYPFFTCSPETLRINSYSFDCEAILLAGNNANGIFALKYYRGKFNAYQRTYVITSNPEDVDIEYIYHQLTLKLQRLENISHGTATKYLTLPLLNEIEIKLPPLSTQHRIADILTALDEKIELNRQTNTTLETIAQTIYKEWFVNFKYPLSAPRLEGLQDYLDYAAALKQGTQPNQDNQDNQENQDTPSTEDTPRNPKNQANQANQENQGADMLESELGPIPQGWRVGKLGDVCILAYGKGLKSENRVDGEYPVIGSSGIVGSHNVFLVEGPGIVIGRKGTIGEVIWVQQNFFPIDTTFYIKDALGLENLYFHYFLLKEQDFKKIGSDSAVPGLNREQAQGNMILIPPTDVIKHFNDFAKQLFNNIFNNNQESATLATIRDTLLPKLMSGEINV